MHRVAPNKAHTPDGPARCGCRSVVESRGAGPRVMRGPLGAESSMAKPKRKLTPREKRERARRRAEFMTVFINGRQKRVRRPPLVDGMDADEFTLRNADPIWLHQNEMWEHMPEFTLSGPASPGNDEEEPS